LCVSNPLTTTLFVKQCFKDSNPDPICQPKSHVFNKVWAHSESPVFNTVLDFLITYIQGYKVIIEGVI